MQSTSDPVAQASEFEEEPEREEEPVSAAVSPETDLARERLARHLCDLLLTGSHQLAANELALAETALVDLLPCLTVSIKRRFADRLAPLESAPATLLSAFLDEPFEVTEGLIREGLCLTNCDLVHLAERGTRAHRLCLAGRQPLSRVVTDAVAAKGEQDVLVRLVENHAATLSHYTIDQMVRRSSAEPELIVLLLQRAELTPWYAHLMFWWADSEERATILKRFTVDRRAIVDVLSGSDDLMSLNDAATPSLRSTYRLLRPARALSESGLERLMSGIYSGSAQKALAAAAGISPTMAGWIIGDARGEPIAILAKALGLHRDVFRDVAAGLSAARLSGSYTENELEHAVALFDSVTMERADSLLHFWDRIILTEIPE